MSKPFNLNDLFIYDLANNHQGDIEHASNIVREVARFGGDVSKFVSPFVAARLHKNYK